MNEETMKILLVDDEANILKSLQRLLFDEDYEIFAETSGKDALEVMNNNKDIALIISDQRMPEMSGSEFLEKAKELSPDTVRILLTGYSDMSAALDAINKGGISRFLSKPWKDEELLQVIKSSVNEFQLLRDNKRLNKLVLEQNEELKVWSSTLEEKVEEQTVKIREQNIRLDELNKQLKKDFSSSMKVFSELIELRDINVKNHSKKVAELAKSIAVSLKLPAEKRVEIYIGGLLHDIGKIGVSDEILSKDIDNLTETEFKEYMKHSVRGQSALEAVDYFHGAGILVRHHHEAYNGLGFPDKLKGDDIPIGARIIAIADFIDKTIHKFKGRKAIEKTLNLLKEESRKRFDPHIYPVLKDNIRTVYSALFLSENQEEYQVEIDWLKVGMVLSKDLKTGTGLLLLTRGTKLNDHTIDCIKRYAKIDPSDNKIYVLS